MNKVSRRSFARSAVIAAATAAVMPAALAQTQPVPPKTTAAEPKPPANTPVLPPASQAEVDARVNWILDKYGARLDDGQRADIRRLIRGGQEGIDTLRAFPLDNSMQPAPAFRVDRAKQVTK